MSKSEEFMLRLELMALQDAYVAALDNDRLEEWPEFFADDCFYEIIPKENTSLGLPAPIMYCDNKSMMRDRVISLRNANIYSPQAYKHFLSGYEIRADKGEEIQLTANYLVVNTNQDGNSFIFQAGLYEDRVVRTPSGLRFKSKRAIFDTSKVLTLLAYPV
jgi:anthranilate 1,2-dioxygenase small subunit